VTDGTEEFAEDGLLLFYPLLFEELFSFLLCNYSTSLELNATGSAECC